MIQIEPLGWDSNFFHRTIGRCHLHGVLDQQAIPDLNHRGFDTIYIFSNVEQLNFHPASIPLTDTKLTLHKSIHPLGNITPNPTDFAHPTQANPALEALFLSSGQYSRYKTDPVFTPMFEPFYREWLHKALDKSFADEFVTTGPPNHPSGLLVLKKTGKSMHISIIAVDTNLKGKGIGRSLINFAEDAARKSKFKSLTVDTQEKNIEAMRFYTAMGFEVERRLFVYHWHGGRSFTSTGHEDYGFSNPPRRKN